jgi:hypothetical protein
VFSAGEHRGDATIGIQVTEQLLEARDGAELLKTVLRTTKWVVREVLEICHASAVAPQAHGCRWKRVRDRDW